MPSRLQSRVSAAEEKVAGGGPDDIIRLYFVQGYPTDGAEDLLRAKRSGPVCPLQDRLFRSCGQCQTAPDSAR